MLASGLIKTSSNHSNLRFNFWLLRNYLEKIYDMIIDFTRDEEAKYQGLLTSKEVQSFLSEPAENRSRPSSKSSDRKVKTAASDKSKKKKGINIFFFLTKIKAENE